MVSIETGGPHPSVAGKAETRSRSEAGAMLCVDEVAIWADLLVGCENGEWGAILISWRFCLCHANNQSRADACMATAGEF